MKSYKEMKDIARNQAIEWQATFAQQNYSYGELADWAEHFERLGRRFGLLAEFRENGII